MWFCFRLYLLYVVCYLMLYETHTHTHTYIYIYRSSNGKTGKLGNRCLFQSFQCVLYIYIYMCVRSFSNFSLFKFFLRFLLFPIVPSCYRLFWPGPANHENIQIWFIKISNLKSENTNSRKKKNLTKKSNLIKNISLQLAWWAYFLCPACHIV